MHAFVDFAVENADADTWLYLSNEGPDNQGGVNQADFNTWKGAVLQALAPVSPNVIDEKTRLTVTYQEDPADGWPERRVQAMQAKLTGGCVALLFLTKRGAGDESDLLELLKLIKVGD